ncbi:MAG TPA: division/cell wall cluster transcriptional repressor MraZ [Polyangiaceae bacterium]|nr:division/cell wall cluster transcriptional repressor MraZ [Polyangiaceae bacterium]
MFRGRHEHTIDAKGRTSVPARYRDALDAAGERRIVVTSGLDPCLVAYAPSEWNDFESALAKLPRFDRAVQKLKRLYVSGAVECDIDDVGRILIPPALRDYAKLKKDVLWAGSGRYAELWDKDEWLRYVETTDDERRDIAARLSELGL